MKNVYLSSLLFYVFLYSLFLVLIMMVIFLFSMEFSENMFDMNVVMVLLVFLCVLICLFGLNFIMSCVLSCLSLVFFDDIFFVCLVNMGMKKKVFSMFFMMSYIGDFFFLGLDFECVMCFLDFVVGECIWVLLKCNYGFYVWCIDKWLNLYLFCFICSYCLIEIC